MWHLREPSPERIRAFLAGQAGEAFSYPAVGATRCESVAAPPGYDLDHNRALLGEEPDMNLAVIGTGSVGSARATGDRRWGLGLTTDS